MLLHGTIPDMCLTQSLTLGCKKEALGQFCWMHWPILSKSITSDPKTKNNLTREAVDCPTLLSFKTQLGKVLRCIIS